MTAVEDESALFDGLREIARCESAPSDLGERVMAGIEYRARLERTSDSVPSAPRQSKLWTLVSAACAAASVGIALKSLRSPSPIAAEPTPSAASATASAASAARTQAAVPKLDPCIARGVALGRNPAIDDFEDGDDAVLPFEQRAGFWRWAREIDAPGSAPALLPLPRPQHSAANRLALHVKGGQLSDWGATVEFTFRPACYDASKYAGIGFQARGPGRIYVSPREVAAIPVSEGGTCQDDCYNPHVKKVDLDGRWSSYEVHWEDVRQRGFDKPLLDPSRLNSLAFLIRPEDTPYDVWLDDVRFLTR